MRNHYDRNKRLEKLYNKGINHIKHRTPDILFLTDLPTKNYAYYDTQRNKYVSFERPVGMPYNIMMERYKKPKTWKYKQTIQELKNEERYD